MPRIIPIKELKDTAKISEMCHENEDPIYEEDVAEGRTTPAKEALKEIREKYGL